MSDTVTASDRKRAVEGLKECAGPMISRYGDNASGLEREMVEYLDLIGISLTCDQLAAIVGEERDLAAYSRCLRAGKLGPRTPALVAAVPASSNGSGRRPAGVSATANAAADGGLPPPFSFASSADNAKAGLAAAAAAERGDGKLEAMEAQMAELAPSVTWDALKRVPVSVALCSRNYVLMKLVAYVSLSIVEQVVASSLARWTHLNVDVLIAPLALWDRVRILFDQHSEGRFSARFDTAYTGGKPRRVLQIVWGHGAAAAANSPAPPPSPSPLHQVPLDADLCQRDPLLVKTLYFVHLSVAEQLTVNHQSTWTCVQVDAHVAPFPKWQAVCDVFSRDPQFDAHIETVSSATGDRQILYIHWKRSALEEF